MAMRRAHVQVFLMFAISFLLVQDADSWSSAPRHNNLGNFKVDGPRNELKRAIKCCGMNDVKSLFVASSIFVSLCFGASLPVSAEENVLVPPAEKEVITEAAKTDETSAPGPKTEQILVQSIDRTEVSPELSDQKKSPKLKKNDEAEEVERIVGEGGSAGIQVEDENSKINIEDKEIANSEKEETQQAEVESNLKSDNKAMKQTEEEASSVFKIEEDAKTTADAEAKSKVDEEARLSEEAKTEAEAKAKAEEEARLLEEAKAKAEEEARNAETAKAEAEAKARAEEEARIVEEVKKAEEAKAKAEEEARLAEARRKAEEGYDRLKAEAEARMKARMTTREENESLASRLKYQFAPPLSESNVIKAKSLTADESRQKAEDDARLRATVAKFKAEKQGKSKATDESRIPAKGTTRKNPGDTKFEVSKEERELEEKEAKLGELTQAQIDWLRKH